ncbi:MAG: hypothetical protein WC969_14410 [Elusimicrobiota bacterium]|jgi:hypothetical protein
MKLALFAVLLPFFALPARAGTAAAAAEEEGGRVEYLEDKTQELKDAVANPTLDSQDVHALAARLFETVPNERTTRMPTFVPRGWQKPVRETEANVESLMGTVQRGLEVADVPPPKELIDAYLYGREMKHKDLMAYDEEGDKLKGGVIGAYIYDHASAVAILFNRTFRALQRWLGDELAGATAVHEGAHARDHQHGLLNPIEVKKGEKLAFQTEYLWLKMADPSGEKLCWSRVTIGKFSGGKSDAPGFVADYLEHLAKIREFGDKGDFDGLVDALGYQDRKSSPYAPG